MGTRMQFSTTMLPDSGTPIKELEDIDRVRFPDFSRDGRLPVLEATDIAVAEVGSEVCVSTVLAGPFTTAAALRPIEHFIKDLYKNREWVHRLLDLCCRAGSPSSTRS
jgi:uroporphyrinogen decarboxylase